MGAGGVGGEGLGCNWGLWDFCNENDGIVLLLFDASTILQFIAS